MKWIVGLDLRPFGQGALEFAAWLHAHTTAERLIAVHVLEEAAMRQALREHSIGEVERRAREATEAFMARQGLAESYSAIDVVEGVTADASLGAALQLHRATGVIVGRRAPAGEDALVLLGRVARRLLRALPGPVVVVPPDVTRATMGKGPILLATDLHDDCLGAAGFARQLSVATGRPLVVVHTVDIPEQWGLGYVPAATMDQLYGQLRLDGEQGLQAWLTRTGLGDCAAIVAEGPTVARLAAIAKAEDALMLVTGSRKLSLLERVFRSSVGTDLAGAATVPVAVVPPDYAA
jgi:nucleotide-binding universal stress UspA family protein